MRGREGLQATERGLLRLARGRRVSRLLLAVGLRCAVLTDERQREESLRLAEAGDDGAVGADEGLVPGGGGLIEAVASFALRGSGRPERGDGVGVVLRGDGDAPA